jgi:hypothetical protein
MTVSELIAKLGALPLQLEVHTENEGCHTEVNEVEVRGEISCGPEKPPKKYVLLS